MRKAVLMMPVTLFVAAISAVGGYWLCRGGAEFVPSATAQTPERTQEESDSKAIGQVIAGPENAIVRQARVAGITTCSRQVASMSDYLTAGTVYSTHTANDQRNPDHAMFSIAIAARSKANGALSWSNMTVAPMGAGCNMAYETVAYFRGTCPAVREAHFAGFSNRVEFGDAIELYLNEGGAAALYLVPAGEGCVTIKKQMSY